MKQNWKTILKNINRRCINNKYIGIPIEAVEFLITSVIKDERLKLLNKVLNEIKDCKYDCDNDSYENIVKLLAKEVKYNEQK
jgi:hypothetical protein